MQIVKTMQVKVVSIGPGKIRPVSETAEAVATTRTPALNNKPPTIPSVPELQDCTQVTLAVVDAQGRYLNRTILSLVGGKMVVNNNDLGAVPTVLNAALTTAFDEIEKLISALNTAGKLPL